MQPPAGTLSAGELSARVLRWSDFAGSLLVCAIAAVPTTKIQHASRENLVLPGSMTRLNSDSRLSRNIIYYRHFANVLALMGRLLSELSRTH
jgi:hypothetical protein